MFKFFISTIITLLFYINVSCQTSIINDKILNQVTFNKVKLEDNFWKPRLVIQAKTLVPYALDKTLPAVQNLEKTAKFLKGDTTDLPFPHRFIDSDLYKTMEGASYILMDHPDSVLENRMDKIIDIISQAQKPDGYLYVAHITGVSKNHDHWGGGGMGDKPYSFVLHSHELYNMGHMYEAAVAYYQATGKDKWLKIAEKSAQHINKVFFEGDTNYNNGKPVNLAPGHEELELALVKLYRATGNKLYLEMAHKFLDIRGKTFVPKGEGVMAPTYSQQQQPVADQRKAVGHAVRACYLYSGMADVSTALGITDYNIALDSIWHNIVDTKMHITGGLGAIHGIEGFGPEYLLPNKEAYNETCAAVGKVLFNFRMFLMTHDAKYMDVAEVALMNNVLAGVNLEGNRFFYVNPLESDGITPFNQGTAGRAPWFGTACCPTNLARLIPQVSGMMYSYDDKDIYVTLYASSETTVPLKTGKVNIIQRSDYPFSGNVRIVINSQKSQIFNLKLRIPTWAQGEQFVPGNLYYYINKGKKNNYIIKVNGKNVKTEIKNGFAEIERKWMLGDKVELVLKMNVQYSKANEKVEADRNRIAITRGPLIYCAESTNKNEPVQRLFLDKIPYQTNVKVDKIESGILKNIFAIEMPLKLVNATQITDKQVSLIPYYAWNNRGNNSMEVWLPTHKEQIIYLDEDILRGGKFSGVKASSVSMDANLSAISDNRRPMNSRDLSISPWKSSPQDNNKQWIEIELEKKPIRCIGLYWFVDGNKVDLPSSWSMEYKKDGEWKPFDVYVTDSYGTDLDKYNVVHPGSLLICSAVRININPQKGKTIGILNVDVTYEN